MRKVLAVLLLAGAAHASDRDLVIQGNTAFAIDVYKREASARRGNVFVSPYSISAAMALVGVGARATTASEIEKALHMPFGGSRLAQAWKGVLDDVNENTGGAELSTANALWAAKAIEIRPEYLELSSKQFEAKVERLDFAGATEASRARINEWVSEATRQKIRELLARGLIIPQTQLVLTNALYLKAKWNDPFAVRATEKKGRFHAPGGDTTAPMMNNGGSFRFYHGGGVRVIELPYTREQLAMLVVLPDARDGLAAVEASLTAARLAEWDVKLVEQNVHVRFPRFIAEMALELKDRLRAMGVLQAFDPNTADFSGITYGKKIAISQVVHKARIDVAEEGTEAAAATAVIMMPTSAVPVVAAAPPQQFNADHPFFFAIRRHETKSILFAGRLVKP